ncbi:MAG: helix-turn-helix domain-containing protein [Bacteroidales bacterium]|nr:helix-turn-helix domain-containing protein [Bacteroidales bacterium]
MCKLKSEREYQVVMERIEELNPLITDDMNEDDKLMIEFSILVDLAEEYEDKHYPIGTPSISELIQLKLQEKEMSQKTLAKKIGISSSRISDYINGKAEPTLKIARLLCKELDILPSEILA